MEQKSGEMIVNIQIRATQSVVLKIDEMRSGLRPIPTRQDFIRDLIEREAAKITPPAEPEPAEAAPIDPAPLKPSRRGRRNG